MNLLEPPIARLTPWQREISGIAAALRERFSATAPMGSSSSMLWWGAGYSDLLSSCSDQISRDVVFADNDPRRLRRSKAMAGEDARTVRLLALADLRRDTTGVESALKSITLRDIDSYLAFEDKLLHRFQDSPAVADGWAGVVVMDFILNRVGADAEALVLAEAFRAVQREGCVLSVMLVADEPTDAQPVKSAPPGPALRLPTERDVLRAFERTGFHGLRMHWSAAENPLAIDRIGGVDVRMCIVEAYRGKQGPCLELGQAVIYAGPWSEVRDDDGHVYRRGERVAVCAKTYDLLMRAPYQGQLTGLRSASEPLLEQALPFDCNTPALRDPKVTKGLAPFMGSRSSASACDPESGCC
ncbi:MAG: hypothetical protein EON49_01510 [Acidovorax sp.]|nr:MAG: hypothetical protein EON49_01510 [Acidovorax sp.]